MGSQLKAAALFPLIADSCHTGRYVIPTIWDRLSGNTTLTSSHNNVKTFNSKRMPPRQLDLYPFLPFSSLPRTYRSEMATSVDEDKRPLGSNKRDSYVVINQNQPILETDLTSHICTNEEVQASTLKLIDESKSHSLVGHPLGCYLKSY
jgi:hypothetical protein